MLYRFFGSKVTALFIFGIIVLNNVSHAKAAQECSLQPFSDVFIRVYIDEEPLDVHSRYTSYQLYDKSLRSVFGDKVRQKKTSKESVLMGLTSSDYSFDFRVGYQQHYDEGDKYGCAWVNGVDIVLKRKIEIDVAKSLKKGSCAYRYILEHELNHVKVEETLTDYYLPIMQEEVSAYVGKVGMINRITRERAKEIFDIIMSDLDRLSHAVLGDMNHEKNRLNAMLDTPEEYARISKLVMNCPVRNN